MTDLVLCVATRKWAGWNACVSTWLETARSSSLSVHVVSGMDVMPAYQRCMDETNEPILGHIHDDVNILEPGWDSRVLYAFRHENIGIVSFTGALGHGTRDLYTSPYRLSNLARQQFMSNMTDAERHGTRFTGQREVAVADGLGLFVRRSLLEKWGGWPLNTPYGYYLYAEALCCECHRQNMKIKTVGVKVEHLGGRTSTVHQVSDDFEAAHKYLYENNRDVLPWRVPEW